MPCEIKNTLEKIAGEKAPGPAPTFSILHILHAIELVYEKPLGRSKLAEKLRIGEGATRTIINRLKKAKLISTSKVGCKLTDKGLKLLGEIRKFF
ncbi:MAG: winged helix-turn-helix domain-containing protein, partial [Candidatus Bathyarchaeia archaeon]